MTGEKASLQLLLFRSPLLLFLLLLLVHHPCRLPSPLFYSQCSFLSFSLITLFYRVLYCSLTIALVLETFQMSFNGQMVAFSSSSRQWFQSNCNNNSKLY